MAGLTHRKVAAAADVPLGSIHYHFDGMDDLLREAFSRFAETVAGAFERRMLDAAGPQEAREAVVAIITEEVFESQRALILTQELYTLAARERAFRDVTSAWMARSRLALERHFDPVTARLLDALIEGLTLHRALEAGPLQPPATVTEAVDRMTGGGKDLGRPAQDRG